MPHVGVQGLAAGDAQNDRAKHEKAVLAVRDEEPDGMERIHRAQDLGVAHDPGQPARRDGDEPAQGHGAEHGADAASAAFLHPEQGDENAAGQGRDDGREGVGRDL